jgi:hypothetical protein
MTLMRLSKALLSQNTAAAAMPSQKFEERVCNYGQRGSLEKAKMMKILHLTRNESFLKMP